MVEPSGSRNTLNWHLDNKDKKKKKKDGSVISYSFRRTHFSTERDKIRQARVHGADRAGCCSLKEVTMSPCAFFFSPFMK